jgi:hypothetical protein
VRRTPNIGQNHPDTTPASKSDQQDREEDHQQELDVQSIVIVSGCTHDTSLFNPVQDQKGRVARLEHLVRLHPTQQHIAGIHFLASVWPMQDSDLEALIALLDDAKLLDLRVVHLQHARPGALHVLAKGAFKATRHHQQNDHKNQDQQGQHNVPVAEHLPNSGNESHIPPPFTFAIGTREQDGARPRAPSCPGAVQKPALSQRPLPVYQDWRTRR